MFKLLITNVNNGHIVNKLQVLQLHRWPFPGLLMKILYQRPGQLPGYKGKLNAEIIIA